MTEDASLNNDFSFADSIIAGAIELGSPDNQNDLESASSVVLFSLISDALEKADHWKMIPNISVKEALVGQCFLCACAFVVKSELKNESQDIDLMKLIASTGNLIFQHRYSEEEINIILPSGFKAFQEIVKSMEGNSNMKDWLDNVSQATRLYVLSIKDEECRNKITDEGLKALYFQLWNCLEG